MRPSRVLLVAVGVIAALPSAGSAAPCAPGLCAPGTGPCRIEATCELPEPLTIDLGGRALVVGRGVTVTVVRGPLAITAASATLEPGARVVAPDHLARGGGTISLTASGGIHLQADGTGKATIDVTGEFFAGTIALHAGADIVIDGPLVAVATRFGFGGIVTIDTSGGSIALNGPIVARAGSPGDGGHVFVAAPLGAISVVAPIDATGGNGGDIAFDAKGDLVVAPAATLDVSSAGRGTVLGPVGFGGFIRLLSRQGNIAVAASMRAAAAREENDFSGVGGDVDIAAFAGSVELLGTVDVSAPAPDGTAGALFVLAGRDLTQRGTVLAAGAGEEGEGGLVDLEAGDVLTLGSMDLRGGFSDAGELRATSRGTVVLGASAEIDGRGTADGRGAAIDIEAPTVTVAGRLDLRSQGKGFEGGTVDIRGTTVTMSGRIDLRAQGAEGFGGTVLIDACALSVPPGASIVSGGAEGDRNALIAHSSLTLGGIVIAGGQFGMNDVVHGFLPPPVIPPGTFDPPPRLSLVAVREPCPGAVGTTTTTRPPGTSTTTTTTTTTGTRPVVTNSATTTTAVSSTASTAPPTTLVSACTSDAPAACDDGDSCTADGCVDGRCANEALPDFADARCRLEAVHALVRDAAPAVAGGRRFQARLDRRLVRVRDMVDAAASGRGGRAIRLLRRARRELGPVIRAVGKRHGVAPDLAAKITAGAEDLRRRLRPLETLVRSRTKNR